MNGAPPSANVSISWQCLKIKAPVSYYGSKSKLAHLYPPPQHGLIVEPFAGAGCYSWLHRAGREVWLNDLDARTYSIWKFLTSEEACDIVENIVPDTVEPGQKVSDLIPEELPGLREICRAEANQGTQGAKGVHDQITKMGAKCWKVKRKLREVIPEVKNWKITNIDYKDLMNVDATWFVDPPYSNAAGSRYRTNDVDYEQLGWWCLNRRGLTIVCENEGASWLPFQPLDHPRVSIRSRYQKANAREVMWTNAPSVETLNTPSTESKETVSVSPSVDRA